MTKDVSIRIRSVQSAETGNEEIEIFTFGKLSRKENDNNYQLSYEDSEATGYEGCNVTLDVSKNVVTMTRSGNVSSCLTVEKGKKHHCHYGTPYGDIMIGINTNNLRVKMDDSGGILYFKYTIDVNSGFLSENKMIITVKERNDNSTERKKLND